VLKSSIYRSVYPYFIQLKVSVNSPYTPAGSSDLKLTGNVPSGSTKYWKFVQ